MIGGTAFLAPPAPVAGDPSSGRVPSLAATGGEAARLDALKGIFIVLVVAGHNHTAALLAGEARGGLYLVHVVMFLYLPFLRTRRAWGSIGWGDCLVRYGWPMVVFTVLYAGLFAVFSGHDPAGALAGVPFALVAMSAPVFESLTGLQILWFLPTLIGLRLVLKALSSPRAPSLPVLLALSLPMHLCVGLLPQAWLWVTPFGWPIVAYLLFPGLLVHLLHRAEVRIPLRRVGPALVLVVILAYVYRVSGPVFSWHGSGPFFTLSKVDVPSIAEPARLIAADVAQIITLFSAITLCGLASVRTLFAGIGRQSFEIFLFHQPIYIALLGLSQRLGFGAENLAAGLALLACTIALSLAAALLLDQLPLLRRVVFPAGLPAWRGRRGPARGVSASASSSDSPAVR